MSGFVTHCGFLSGLAEATGCCQTNVSAQSLSDLLINAEGGVTVGSVGGHTRSIHTNTYRAQLFCEQLTRGHFTTVLRRHKTVMILMINISIKMDLSAQAPLLWWDRWLRWNSDVRGTRWLQWSPPGCLVQQSSLVHPLT